MHDRSAFPIDQKGIAEQMPTRTERSIGDQIRESTAEVRQEDPRGQQIPEMEIRELFEPSEKKQQEQT